jgi:single-strand DNA-binding protein
MSINKVILIGNVGTDPEIRNTNDGREIASFSLATSESWKDKNSGEKKEKTEWHRLVVFSQGLVGIVKNYVKKGSKLYIEGQLQTRKWTDKDGADKYTTEIVLQGFNSTIQLVGGKGLQDAGIDKALDVVDKSKTNGTLCRF